MKKSSGTVGHNIAASSFMPSLSLQIKIPNKTRSKSVSLYFNVVLISGWLAVTPSYLPLGGWGGSDGPRVVDLVQVRRNVPYQSAASVQVSRSY